MQKGFPVMHFNNRQISGSIKTHQVLKLVATSIVISPMTIGERLKTSKFRTPAQEALLALLVAGSHVRSLRDVEMSDLGITPEQYNILRILKGVYPEGHSCGDISCRMVDRAPDITRRIDALVKLGYVTRDKSKEDRRVVIVTLTKLGIETLAKVNPSIEKFETELGNLLSDAECKQLVTLCEKFLDLQPT